MLLWLAGLIKLQKWRKGGAKKWIRCAKGAVDNL
jgi:hypothetical protein